MMKLKCQECGVEATATGGLSALLNAGWEERHAVHCEYCECFAYLCPKCAPKNPLWRAKWSSE